jgi:hypothetical protein
MRVWRGRMRRQLERAYGHAWSGLGHWHFCAGADLAHGAAVVLAEIGNRFVIGNEPAREPHHLNVAPGLTLKPAARLDPIAVDIEPRSTDG